MPSYQAHTYTLVVRAQPKELLKPSPPKIV